MLQIPFPVPTMMVVFLVAAGCASSPDFQKREVESEALFAGPVKDVLEHRCIHCHDAQRPSAGLNLQDRNTVFAQQALGPFVVPGEPKDSRLWLAVSQPDTHPRVMPGDGWGLTSTQRDAFERWITTGAYWPEDTAGQLQKKDYRVDIEDGL